VRHAFSPSHAGEGSHYAADPRGFRDKSGADVLPVPPPHLRMGYGTHAAAQFLEAGRTSAEQLRQLLDECGVRWQRVESALDWGCATGRVLRWFADEARDVEFWGVDQDETSIRWAKENLSPPFHFLTGTAWPHLPFPDDTFGVVYGLSVFTHIEHLVDAWLMEFRRVMKRGAVAVFTIHDEDTVRYFQGRRRPRWMPPSLALADIAAHEITVVRGPAWSATYTFFQQAYIRREWSRYFEVVDIKALHAAYQSAVVLRKR
jgi:SAM-dependent methyltransferase